ncbi:cytochrome P460 family protein [Mesorhizobium sp. AR10]|uniref:cytochrome P460 family protein n=1 Tax=Mesorhizobium sp. AR10 TaxID=2865839 RepID=UPI0021607E2D|nr:cytochrome P460 family protein [Mesorhizobium sp. AR10]UVK38042.1 cytochrome P460 family protein [Mesorhizobium sp. AR10]
MSTMIDVKRLPLIVATGCILALSGLSVRAESNRVTFPENFDKYVLYATYDRGSSKEEAFATPETLEIAKSGKPLPPGTQIVLGIWTNYELSSYFVMHKGEGWGLDFDEERRTGDWQFQQFDTAMQVMASSNPSRCQSCHSSQRSNDFMFTIDRMRAYLP